MTLVAFTRTLLVAEIRRQLQERTASRFQDADVTRWIDIALTDIAVKTRCLRTSATFTCSASTQEYTITANAIGPWAITRVEYNGAKLEPRALDQIDRELAGATGKSLSSTGTPVYWIPYGRTLMLWPVPATSGATVKYWYPKMPDSLSADAMSIADLGFSLAYGPAVESFCVRRGFLFAGDLARAEGAGAAYQDDLARAADKGMPDNVPEEVRGSG